MKKQELIKKLEEKAKIYGMFGDNTYIIKDAYHGCRPGADRLWCANAVEVIGKKVTIGKVTWDFDNVENYDMIDDASNYPWEDEKFMEFEDLDEYSLNDNDDCEELLNLI
jgi:hypothetical protein